MLGDNLIDTVPSGGANNRPTVPAWRGVMASENGLPTIEDVLAESSLTLVPDQEDAAPPSPSWIGGGAGLPMPAALVEELGRLHTEIDTLDQRRAAVFRGFLIGTGLPISATYDLSTGLVIAP